MENLVVLAVGGSVITERAIDEPNINSKNIELIASEIMKARKAKNFKLIIVHGMGAYGHPIAKKYQLNSEKENFNVADYAAELDIALSQLHMSFGKAELDISLDRLNLEFVKRLIRHNINSVHVRPQNPLTDRGRIISISLDGLKKALDKNYVPVIRAGPCEDVSFNLSILSSDHLAPYIANEFKADLLIGGTSVDGVYNMNPKIQGARIFKKITPQNYEEVVRGIFDAGYVDVTGGMLRKVSEYMDFAKKGVKSRIINLTKENVLSETILGKDHGTLFTGN